MTSQDHNMAILAGWLEENCGEIQAQFILDQIKKIRHQGGSLQCIWRLYEQSPSQFA